MSTKHALILLAALALGVYSDLDVNVWVETGYYYGYNCQLTFQFIADNFSSAGENIHLYTDGSIGFEEIDDNSMLVQAADLKEYQFYSYQCPVTDRNQTRTCFQIFGQVDNVIPSWAQLLRPYNSTHNYFLARIRIAYCPVNHTITPTLNIVVPASYSGAVFGSGESGVKYNKTINVSVGNLTYRDLGWVAPKQDLYQLGCASTYVMYWTFIYQDFASSWYQATLTFENISTIAIDVTNCAPFCQLSGSSLVFTNMNRSDAVKNMTAWSNDEFNNFSILANRNNSVAQTLAFTFNFSEEATVNYSFSVSSTFLYNNTLPPLFEQQNITYHGYTNLSMKLLSEDSYYNLTGAYLCTKNADPPVVPDTVVNNSSSFLQSLKNFMSQFSLIILGVYCLLTLIIRRIPFLVEKIVYLLLCASEIPLTLACLVVEKDEVRYKILVIFIIVEQILSKVFFINYCLIFCRKQGLNTSIQSPCSRFKIYLMSFYNFRLCYLVYSKVPCCSTISNVRYGRKTILITHAVHLILGAGAKLFLIIVDIGPYLINIGSFSLQTMFIIVQLLTFILTMLIIKYSLMVWRNIRAKEVLSHSSNTPPPSLEPRSNGLDVQQDDRIQPGRDFMDMQSMQLPAGVSEVRGLAAYDHTDHQLRLPSSYLSSPPRSQNAASSSLPPRAFPSASLMY